MQKNILNQANWEYLMKYLHKIDSNFLELSINKSTSKNDKIVGNLLCLQEEVGEFTTEIRKFTKMMFNQKKVDSFKIEDLEDEACDILIVLILTLRSCGIDSLDAAMKRKIEKNESRGY